MCWFATLLDTKADNVSPSRLDIVRGIGIEDVSFDGGIGAGADGGVSAPPSDPNVSL